MGMKDAFTEGNSEEDWIKKLFAKAQLPITYDDFKSKGYYVYPFPADYWTRLYNPQLLSFYNNTNITASNGLVTPTGKLEIFSTKIYQYYGLESKTAGCGAIPKYRESFEGRNSHPLVDKYPLQMLTPHPRLRYHGKYDQVTWLRDMYKVVGPDGYAHEPIYMHQADAAARGLKNGDIVRVFNDRGQILCGVQITKRATQGVVLISYGSWNDFASPGVYGSLEKAGNSNVLTASYPPDNVQSHECGEPWNTSLVQVERWVG